MKKIFLISILILLCAIAIKGFMYAEDLKAGTAPEGMSGAEAELRSSMRTLWESRAILLRAYIVSAMNDSKDADDAKDKLLKNAGDLGDTIKPYYGGWASGILTGYLKTDVRLTEKVIKAVKEGREEALELIVKARKEALDLTETAKAEAIVVTDKAEEEALDLTAKAVKEAPEPTDEGNKEDPDPAEKAKEEALKLTDKAKEEALDLADTAKAEAIKLNEKGNKEALAMTEKAREKALDLTETAKKKAMVMTEKAKDKALGLAEKDNKEVKAAAMDLVKKAKEIAMDLVKKAREIAMDLTEKARKEALRRDKEARREALELAKKKWYENARGLASFFAIPHNQTKKDLTDMLYKHLDLTWGGIEAILTKDKAKELDYYERDRAHMIMFSDVLVDGLVKQFPSRFKE